MRLALDIAALTVVLLIVHEAFRRSGSWLAWLAFFVLPIALTPHWISVNEFGLFAWAKLYTVLFSAFWLAALRFTAFGRQPWARAGLTVLFALNILEAVAVDFGAARPLTLMNAFAGLLLIATLPRFASAVCLDTNRFRDLHYHGLGRAWIVGFTIWNWTFLLLNYPVIAGHHLAVLGATLLVGLIDTRRWLQARCYILAADLIALATFRDTLVPRLDTSHWSGSPLALVAGVAAVAVASMSCVALRHRFHSASGEVNNIRPEVS